MIFKENGNVRNNIVGVSMVRMHLYCSMLSLNIHKHTNNIVEDFFYSA
jgi:hypothetical protein